MYSLLLWTTTFLLCAPDVLANPKVVSMRLGRSERPTIHKRDPQAVMLGHNLTSAIYYVNASIGTPAQVVKLQIDTGSSDVWMFGPDVTQSLAESYGGSYWPSALSSTTPTTRSQYHVGSLQRVLLADNGPDDPSQSNTYSLISEGGFNIQYVMPGSQVTGDYFADSFTLGGMTMQNLTMAVATDAAAVITGIMGIGFDTEESSVVYHGAKPYPSIMDVMVQQQLINTRAYSLYLDDFEAGTGTVLFGGYDTEKYTGDLTFLGMQPDAESGSFTMPMVTWSILAVTDSTGTHVVSQADFPLPAVLDSGTALAIVPSDVFDKLANYFGVFASDDGTSLVNCSNAQLNGTVDYGFGGDGGPVISVPFSELIIPSYDDQGDHLLVNGSAACALGFAPAAEGSPILLGDTFLRSAYVVYDLDNKQIGIANSVWNSDSSHIREIGSSSNGKNAVSAASSAVGVNVTQTASAKVEPGIGTGGTGTLVQVSTSAAAGNHTLGPTTTLGGASGVHGTADPTSTATGSTSSATSSTAASPPLLSVSLWGLVIVLVNVIALMLGGAAVLLVA